MAVTILKRPQGHILDTTLEDALVTDDYGNQGALFDNPNHGLVDGDYIYVISNIEDYNGFWYVEQINSRFFWLREYASGSLLQWVVDGVVNYYKATSTHGWSAVHLPIVYKLSNDRWPTNSIDTVRTISSVTDDNGYCALSLSGDIKASGSAAALDYIKVSTGTLAGTYQIISYTNDTTFTINVLYSAANDTALTSESIQYYYNNYNVRVKIYAGLSAAHYWTAQKPYAEILQRKIVPDSSNEVALNINEFLKEKIEILKNNLLGAELPNDIDSFCQFYISTAESYDTSDGTTVTQSTPSFTSDSSNFEGMAVNSNLPFKNRYSGYLSEYIPDNANSKFLTLFNQPVYWPGCFFDISFLVKNVGLYLRKEYYLLGELQTTVNELLTNYGLGFYRHPLVETTTYDRLDLTLSTDVITSSDWYDDTDYSLWSPYTLAGAAAGWVEPLGLNIGVTSGISGINLTAGEYTNYYRNDVPVSFLAGWAYSFDLTYREQKTAGTQNMKVDIVFMNESGTVLGTGTTGYYPVSTDAVVTKTISVTASAVGTRIGIVAYADAGNSGRVFCTLRKMVSPVLGDLSETKTININTECHNNTIYMTWKNYLGGHDYWLFDTEKDYGIEIEDSTEATKNIFPSWPNSYGETADTVDYETSRQSRNSVTVFSQNVDLDQLQGIQYIKTSPLVQVVTSQQDRRTVIVDKDSFTVYSDGNRLYNIQFKFKYTDLIPSQSL